MTDYFIFCYGESAFSVFIYFMFAHTCALKFLLCTFCTFCTFFFVLTKVAIVVI